MGNSSNEHEFLTAPEAAYLLRCSTRTLARMRALGTGPSFHKHSGRILYPRSLVRAWVEQSITVPVRSAS